MKYILQTPSFWDQIHCICGSQSIRLLSWNMIEFYEPETQNETFVSGCSDVEWIGCEFHVVPLLLYQLQVKRAASAAKFCSTRMCSESCPVHVFVDTVDIFIIDVVDTFKSRTVHVNIVHVNALNFSSHRLYPPKWCHCHCIPFRSLLCSNLCSNCTTCSPSSEIWSLQWKRSHWICMIQRYVSTWPRSSGTLSRLSILRGFVGASYSWLSQRAAGAHESELATLAIARPWLEWTLSQNLSSDISSPSGSVVSNFSMPLRHVTDRSSELLLCILF